MRDSFRKGIGIIDTVLGLTQPLLRLPYNRTFAVVKYYQMNREQWEMVFLIIGTFLGTMLLLALIVLLA